MSIYAGCSNIYIMVPRAAGIAYNTKRGTIRVMKRATVMLVATLSFATMVAVLSSHVDYGDKRVDTATQGVFTLPEQREPLDGCRKAKTTDTACLQAWLLNGVSEVGTRETLRAFTSFMEKYPDSIKNCHEPTHALGSVVWESRGSTTLDELFSLGGEACLMGYVHGLLESLAKESPSPDTLKGVFGSCERSYAATGREQLCYDGVGHAAWSAYKDVEKAVAVCVAAGAATDRRSCETGIMMQIFKPAHLEASMILSPDLREAVDLCNTWPVIETKDGSDPARGCWDGVAYLIHEQLSGEWFRDGAKPVEDDIIRWSKRFFDVSDVCNDLKDGARLCYQNLGRYVMLPWTGLNWEVAEAMCTTRPELATGCLWEAANGGMNAGAIERGDVKEFLKSVGYDSGDFKWSP
jgi:hypothetical protein